ncbi:MAG: cobyric acid synthase [Bacillota bacterium]
MTARTIMFQGTGSDVGKSVLTAALCRILARDGYEVAPFKSQNMSLNSFITRKGKEMGRAQAFQAEAARVIPRVEMNPVLLKPNADDNSQVILAGKPHKNMTAREYFNKQKQAEEVIATSLEKLKNNYQVLVLEGAGSPAEVNLREYDLVNMRIARMARAPVILIASIEKGGVFADIVGTLELLTEEERKRIKGIIINKFYGAKERFSSGVEFIEEYTGKPVLGVIPYFSEMNLPEEDSLARKTFGAEDYQIDIAVIDLPHISNFTDFDFLAAEPRTRVRYLKDPAVLKKPDLLIIPGSKNTVGDLNYLYQTGMGAKIKEMYEKQVPIVGICGGYQMLGQKIKDPRGIEIGGQKIKGLGLLEIETTLQPEKITSQVEAYCNAELPFLKGDYRLKGYEIHQGKTERKSGVKSVFKLMRKGSEQVVNDGAHSKDYQCWGTYLHGVFDNDNFRRDLINYLRQKKGLSPLAEETTSSRQQREQAYEKFAEFVYDNLNMKLVKKIIFQGEEI